MTIFRRTLLIIIAILFCAIIWYIGPLVAIGKFHPISAVWIRVLLIAIILGLVFWPILAALLSIIFRYFTKPFKQKKHVTKDKDRITTIFHDTVSTLKRSGSAANKSVWQKLKYIYNKPYLNDRPWLLIMGENATGKTSIIYGSGETFLYSENYGYTPTITVGPTKDYNMWIGDRAVFVDTAGEWLQLEGLSESTNNSIKNFFKLLKRYRASPKVDALILCIDAMWLSKSTINELKSFADNVRVRILDIANTLKTDIPVYIFINKIDEFPGAKELLFLLNDETIKKGIGFSAPEISFDRRDPNYLKNLYVNYGIWSSKLSDYLLDNLHSDHITDDDKKHLFQFVEAISSLKKPFVRLIEQLFPDYPKGYAGFLHDTWFGTTLTMQIGKNETDLKNLGELYYPAFTRVIDSRGILSTLGAKSGSDFRRWFLYGLVFLFIIIGASILLIKYLWELDYISYISEKFKETKRIVKEITINNQVGSELVYAYEQLDYINSQLFGADKQSFVNPYIEHILIKNSILQTYHKHLIKYFWPAVENYVANTLYSDISNNSQNTYETLRVYKMLADPKHRNSKDLVNWFMSRWDDFAPSGYEQRDKIIFSYHLKELFDGKFDTPNVIKINKNLEHQAIAKSMGIPISQRIINKIKNIPLPNDIVPISLVTAAGSNASLLLRHKSNKTVVEGYIPAFYTRAAYKDVFLENLEKISDEIIDELSWVLNDKSQVNASKIDAMAFKQKLIDDTKKVYFINYANEWNTFLNDITIRNIDNLQDAAFVANQLADVSSPIVNLISFAAKELNITGSNDALSGNIIDRTGNRIKKQKKEIIGEISGNRERFRITPERLLENQFRNILVLGTQVNSDASIQNNPITKLFSEIYNLLYPLSLVVNNDPSANHQQQAIFNQIRFRASNQVEPIRSIILQLIDSSQSAAIDEIKTSVNSNIENLFSTTCKNTLKNKYPFNKYSSSEISENDFKILFSPGGTLDKFYQENISKLEGDQNNILDDKIKDSFRKANKIRDVFFSNNGQNASFDMYIRPISLSPDILEAQLDIDGQIIKYEHNFSKPIKISWPGNDKNNMIKIVFKTVDGNVKIKNYIGFWALFKLYDSSRVMKSGRGFRIINISIPGVNGSFQLEIKSLTEDFPLWNNLLGNYTCP